MQATESARHGSVARLIASSARHPFLTLLLVGALTAWAVFTLRHTKLDAIGRHSLAELRSLQDWHVRYALSSVPGVAEVASVGGMVKQYQVQVDPHQLRAYGVTLGEVARAIRESNEDVGGQVMEIAGH